jgi:simple sugar transport system permease protein
VAAASGVGVSALLLAGLGKSPAAAARVAWQTVLVSPAGLVDTLLQAVPLLMIGLGYLLAYRARVWTIGGEGQFHLGAIAAALVALGAPPAMPRAAGLPLAVAAGVAAGALWALIPGWLRVAREVNEVVSTLMLNFVGALAMSWLIRTRLRDAETPVLQTPVFPPIFDLPTLGDSRLHVGVVLAVLLVPAVAYVVHRSAFGHWLRAIGANPRASRAAGIAVRPTVLAVMVVAGGLSGLAGATHVLGVTHRLLTGVSNDFGYTAILVALLARGHPLAVAPSAVFFSALGVAAEAIQVEMALPSVAMRVFTGVLVLSVLAGEVVGRRFTER